MSKATYTLDIVDPENNKLHIAIGISEERSDEIASRVIDLYKKKNRFSETIREAIEELDNMNEVVFAVLLLARIHDQDNKDASKLEKKLEELQSALELMALHSSLKK